MRIHGLLMVVATLGMLLIGCGKNTSSTPPPEGGADPVPVVAAPAQTTTPSPSAGGGPATSAGGLKWQTPPEWSVQPDRPMRAATYSVPAVSGDPESGEIAVFYFGPNEGGGVQANIDRWIGQMKQPDGGSSAAKAKVEKVQGAVALTMLDVTGTYLASSGPMMQVSAEKPNFRMIGAIAEGPQGAVFFKFTGPVKTVEANSGKFLEVVKGISRE
ncbi:MAG: hypothetical protein KIT83_07170 [Bryobacterales bacterium]|nr:hypothetical protein [Bryobacterales bacterium]